MKACVLCRIIILAQSRTDTLYLVCRYADAYTRTAYQNALVALSAFDFLAGLFCNVGVIRSLSVTAAVDIFDSQPVKELLNLALQLISCVVATYCQDFYSFLSLFASAFFAISSR